MKSRIEKLLDLNAKGLLSDEKLAEAINELTSTTEKEKTPEEIWEEKHNRMAEKNRKYSQEAREKKAARDRRKAEQDAWEDRAIEDIDFLSKQLNKRGERVYTDAYLDSLPYYKLADLADEIRNAKANLEQDREAARQGFNFTRPEVPSNEAPVNLPESPETIVGTSQEPTEEQVVGHEENTNEKHAIETPQEALDNQNAANSVDRTPQENQKPKLISRIGEKLKAKIDGKNGKAIAAIATSLVLLAGGAMLAPGVMLGAAGATLGYAGYKEFKKGMGK